MMIIQSFMFLCSAEKSQPYSNLNCLEDKEEKMLDSPSNEVDEVDESLEDVNDLINQISDMEKNYRELEKTYSQKVKALSSRLNEKDQQFKRLIGELSEIRKLNTDQKAKLKDLGQINDPKNLDSLRFKSRSPKNKNVIDYSGSGPESFSSNSIQNNTSQRKKERSPKNGISKVSPFQTNSSKRVLNHKPSITENKNPNQMSNRSPESIVKKSLSPKNIDTGKKELKRISGPTTFMKHSGAGFKSKSPK